MQYSILYYQDVKRNPDFRYEAEFFLPKYLEQERKLLKVDTILLKECATFSNGRAFDSQEFASDGDIYIAKIGDVTQKRDYQQWELISKNHFNSLKAHCLGHNDILMTLTGDPPDVGKVQLIYEPPRDKLSWNQRVALLRLKRQEKIGSSEYLFTALSSKYCRDHIERWAKGIRQRNVGNPAVLNMAIPILSEIQNHITDIIQSTFSLLKTSKEFYSQAQTLLLSELGFTNWQPKHRLTFVKSYSDIEQVERIDAEYYQPKYEEIAHAIKSYSGGWGTLGRLVDLKDENFRPVDKTEYKYIELANIAGNGEITGCMIEQGQDLPSRARRKVVMGDVIVSSIEGSLDSIALINEEYDQALCSTGFYVINSQAFNSETLLVLLKSIVGQLQLKKGCSGTILTAINKDEFGKVILPIIAEEKQIQIQQTVVESFRLRKQSKHLLECAKRAVEIAIEHDEQTAIDYIENEMQEVYALPDGNSAVLYYRQ